MFMMYFKEEEKASERHLYIDIYRYVFVEVSFVFSFLIGIITKFWDCQLFCIWGNYIYPKTVTSLVPGQRMILTKCINIIRG